MASAAGDCTPASLAETDKASTSEDEFEDASSENLKPVDLVDAFKDCEKAIKKFFNNDVKGAMDLMLPHAGTSLYHSLGGAIFSFIPAILTFDQNRIAEALASIKNCIRICNRNRKHRGFVETLGSIIKKPNYALYTDQEAHAELCYAEALLLQAALTIVDGEDLTGFVKGTLKIRTCHNIYKHCSDIIKAKTWDNDTTKEHFLSGVQLGTAAFNLIISMLPAKFVSLLEFAGYSGNRYYGLEELQRASQAPGLRRILCDLTLLAFNLVLQSFVGGQGNYKLCNDILEKALKEYPESIWFLVFKARYEFLQGNLDTATTIYVNTSEMGQGEFSEFKHLCYWELMWISALKKEFRASCEYANRLIEQSAWSRTTYSYVKACMLMQVGCSASQADHMEVRQLMKDAASYKMRIAGKSLPMEKFVIKRCNRYHLQQQKLVLPYLELLCIWNLLPMLKKNFHILQYMLKSIEVTREVALYGSRAWMHGHDGDNAALLHYMQGCVFAAMQMPRQAIESFQHSLAFKRDLKEDHFLVPYAIADMAMCFFHLNDFDRCKELLAEAAKKKYSGYALESRLHFRIHERQLMLREVVTPHQSSDKPSTS